MKLKEFRVREFRSVWDSGPIKIDGQTTCLVGKNEAGKTTLLDALYRTNPIIKSAAVFDETYDYPKREVEDYRFAVENKDREEAVVVECLYELDDDDIAVVTSVFGPGVLELGTFKRSTYYGRAKNVFHLTANQPKVQYTGQVTFNEPGFRRKPLISTLKSIAGLANSIIALFDF
jgi:hypothetical protein